MKLKIIISSLAAMLMALCITGCDEEQDPIIIEGDLPIKTSALYMVGDATPNGWDIGNPTPLQASADDALIFTYLAFCINSTAASCQTEAEMKKYYEQSVPYLEKARQLDPSRERANWSYPLYQCYYTLYGADDARTKEIESMTK